jgi:glycosyltransferase involved in cell wall biosynthesis
MTSDVVAVIGVPVYNGSEHLPEALESLLGQSFGQAAFVVSDDASVDGTADIVRRYEQLDPRIVFERRPERVGMIANWRAVFERGRSLYPQARYFAWASDHDVWHPFWLERLVAELDAHPEAVLAYPLSLRISETGETLRGPWRFDTAGITRRRERVRATMRGAASGSMVYGLFRTDALVRAGVFRSLLAPDRLLLVELSLYGQFRQVPETLWYRRFAHAVSNARQRRAFFPDGAPPSMYVPWWLTHSVVLARELGQRGTGLPEVSRQAGLGYGALYAFEGAARTLRRAWARAGKRVKRRLHAARLPRMRRVARALVRR